jgi:gluconokinase
MIVVLMGVTGVGKTTVGKLLAARCGMIFYDADDHHPPANVEKMRAGTPLQDSDRWPWLDQINQLLQQAQTHHQSVVLACSALKKSYRERLSIGCDDVRFVLLSGEDQLIRQRLASRKGHYMNPALLDSQLATLEATADCLPLDISDTPEALAERIVIAMHTPRN